MKTNYYILIVDDDPVIREGLTAEVAKEFKDKAEVLSCKNGAIAAELLKCNTIDIVITDIKMPVMNGIELLQFLQSHHIHSKSIVLSSYDDFNLVRDAMKLGACDYLLKPVDLPSLFHLLYKLLTQVMLEAKKTALAAPIDTYKLVEAYLNPPMEKSVEMLAFEEKYAITPASDCILGCIKLQTNSSEKSFKLHEYFRNQLYEHLNRGHINCSTILSGEAASCFVFIIFPETKLHLCVQELEKYTQKLLSENYNIKISGRFPNLQFNPEGF